MGIATDTTLVINGRRIPAAAGQTILDAALAAGLRLPPDDGGAFESVRMQVRSGEVDDAGTRVGTSVLACRSRVRGEAVLECDEVPALAKRTGIVTEVADLSPDILAVVVTLERRLPLLPGQHVKVAFAGLPERDYSPTLRPDGSAELNELVFHIRRAAHGAVSGQIGARIRPDAKAVVRGPFGTGYHRPGPGRLILISTGAGWAPNWAIAHAARYREPSRELIVIASARDPANLYMQQSIDWLIGTGVQRAFMTSSDGRSFAGLTGRATRFLPRLRPGDTVHAAGAPGMVSAARLLASAGGAVCYGNPFASHGAASDVEAGAAEAAALRRPVLSLVRT